MTRSPLEPAGASANAANPGAPESAAPAGSFSLDAALEAIDAATAKVDDEAQLLAAAKCRGLMYGYDARWRDLEWRSLASEETVVLPVVNPETGRTSRTWRHASKHDGVVEGYSKRLLLECKTTSDTDIADPNATYWRRLQIDSQVSKYALDNWQLGRKLDGTLYDVILKPGIRPKEIAKIDRQEIAFKGTYHGFSFAGDVPERETPELYELRLRRDVLERSDRYYQRRVIHRLDGELIEYAGELWAIGKEIRAARLTGRNFRNSSACLEYGRPCVYLALCSGHASLEDAGWRRIECVHDELDGIEGDGRDVLTNSRIKTFQSCRRKHELKYELGIVKADEEEGEALYLGSLMHLALAAWWQTKGVVNGEHSHGDAASGVASSAVAAD